jgi:hypothetical protein
VRERTAAGWLGRDRPPAYRPDRGGAFPENDAAIRARWGRLLDRHLHTYEDEPEAATGSTRPSARQLLAAPGR